MHTSLRLSVLAVVLPAAAQDISTKMLEYLRAQEKVNGFMGSVLVARDGKTLLRTGIGMANLELSVANGPLTKFRLASVTKQFTATAIMQLEQKGKLKVEDTLDKHVPDCPEAWKRVAIHHLLSHTGGVPSYTSDPSYSREMFKPFPLPELISRFRGKPLEFDPGTAYRYSNSGYALLGDIIQRASGVSYEEYLRANIFEPLGMKDSGYDHWDDVLPNRATGYALIAGRTRTAPYLDMTQPHAAGALYSTVDDLYRWDQGLYGERVLPQEALARMFTAVRDNYGYGWMLAEAYGKRVVGHSGGINGFATHILRVPEEKSVVIVLSNLQNSRAARIAQDLNGILHNAAIELPKVRQAIALDPATFAAYEGRYELQPGSVIKVWRDGNRYLLQATGQPVFEIFPESNVRFFTKTADILLEFVRDTSGRAKEIVLRQNDRDRRGRRIE